MLMHWKGKIFPLVMICMAFVSCHKQIPPEPEPDPNPPIIIPQSEQSVFSNGITFPAESQNTPGTGEGGENVPQLQSTTVNFTASAPWSASVEGTKASAWLTIEPSSGVAGNVTMTVTAQPNDTFDDREMSVVITCGGLTISFTVKQTGKPRPIEVSEVSLNIKDLVLVEGESETLTATVKPDDAADKTVFWQSSDVSVASVDDSGTVTAVKEGSAMVIAKAGEKTDTCSVSVSKKVIAVTEVSLNKSSLTLTEGDSETLTATVKPDDATDKAVTWSSSDNSIATVDANGEVAAVKEGSATITAKAGEKSATCSVTVSRKEIAVTEVSLNKSTLTLTEGDSETLTATVMPEDATDKTVTWSSSDNSIATVDANGEVAAVKEGSATITAKAGEKSATCSVTVSKKVIAVTEVTLNKTSLTLMEGDSETLTATVKPDDATDKTVTWSSSDTSISTVDANGKVTAVKEGTATITSKAGEKSATCSVTVNKKVIAVTEISLNKTSLTLTEGDSETLTAIVKPDDATDKSVTWSSSDTSTATVDANGKVTAVKEGTATITSKAGEKSATCSVTVNKKEIAVTEISLNKTSLTLTEGDSETLTATVKPDDATDKTVTWSSSDTSIATVDANGKVTAVKEGTATITAKAGEKTATCSVTVSKKVIAVSEITVSLTDLTLYEGARHYLGVNLKPDDATDKTVTWSTSDASIATVYSSGDYGEVTAIKQGTATITAKAGDKTATCIVTVLAGVPNGGSEGIGYEEY